MLSRIKKCEGMPDLCKEVSLKITKMGLLNVRTVSAQDRAALKVVEHLQFDEAEYCDTCDCSKIGRSAIG